MGWVILAGAVLMGGFTYGAARRVCGLKGVPLYVVTLIGSGVGVLIVLNALNAPATP